MPEWTTKIAQATWSVLRGPRAETKFTPQDPTVNWSYVNHLVYTANAEPYGMAEGDGNSAVFACLQALAYASIEAPLQTIRVVGKDIEPVPDHPIQMLLDEPHPELDILELCFWAAWARHADGNAYIIKVRSGDAVTGQPVQLWPANPMYMEPVTGKGSPNFIDYYAYDYNDGRGKVQIPVENVIHFKAGVDPRDPRKGISRLKRLLREVASDAEATRYQSALLCNYGTPGLVVKLPAEAMVTPDQIRDLKEGIKREFGGDGRGKVGVVTGGADMAQFGFSPNEMNLKVLHDFPETRIAAVMGVDPLVARLGVGLEQTSNYASARQVRENFTELTIVPQWRMDDKKWTQKLARDFTSDRRISVRHDLSEVRSLQEDENAKAVRIGGLYKDGILTREEARSAVGYDPEPQQGDIVYVSPNVTYVEVGQEVTDPVAAAQQQADAAAARLQALNNNNQQNQPANDQQNGSGTGVPAVPPGKARAIDQYSELVQAVVDRASHDFANDLQRLQDGQKRRVQRELVSRG